MRFVNRMRLYSFLLVSILSFPSIAADTDIADRVVRREAAGIDVFVYPMEPKNVVSMKGVMPLGDASVASRTANPAIPELTAMMLERGTTKHDKFVISEILDGLGADLGFELSPAFLAFGGRSLSGDLATLIGLLAEQLHTPAFSAEEFAKVKAEFKARVVEEGQVPQSRAYDALTLAMYPAESLNSPVPRDLMLKAIANATLDEVNSFHKKYYGPDHMILTVTGDVDPDRVQQLVTDAFTGWSGGLDFARTASGQEKLLATGEQSIAMADKASTSVMMGQATGLRTNDADYLPLAVGVHVLGSGFTGRLMSSVRDKEGLTYNISASLDGSEVVSGSFVVATSFAPQLLNKGLASTRRELSTWWEKGISQEDLDNRKVSLVGEHLLGMEGTGRAGNAILETVIRGEPLTRLDDYPHEVRALTVDQVNAAIRKYTDPSKLITVKAGTFSQP